MRKTAVISQCSKYRYVLWRHWNDDVPVGNYVVFVGLNPSTADAVDDDPTIRRCIGFAKDWKFDALCMVNLFAFRATDPADMMSASEPVGVDNDKWIQRVTKYAGLVVAAWGARGSYQNRDMHVCNLVDNLHYLRLTQGGHPGHPLYLPKNLAPTIWKSKKIVA